MKKTFEIHYHTPEGVKSTQVASEENPEKVITQFIKFGLNIEKSNHTLYIPPHSIIAITHWMSKSK